MADGLANRQTAFRLPVALLARLDRYAARLRAEQPGVSVTRADVVRLLLTRALDSEKVDVAARAAGRRGWEKR